jgi:phage gpG-like protein
MGAIDRLLSKIEPGEVLNRIGLRLTNRIKLNITRQRVVDSGKMRASTTFNITGSKLQVGIFGVKYAKFHEFGTKPSIKMARWIFANLKRRGKRSSKGVIEWGGSGRNRTARIKARPFFRPSIEQEKQYISDIIRSYYLGNK